MRRVVWRLQDGVMHHPCRHEADDVHRGLGRLAVPCWVVGEHITAPINHRWRGVEYRSFRIMNMSLLSLMLEAVRNG